MPTSLNGESMKLQNNQCNHTLILLNRNTVIYIQISHMVNLARVGEGARALFGILNRESIVPLQGPFTSS